MKSNWFLCEWEVEPAPLQKMTFSLVGTMGTPQVIQARIGEQRISFVNGSPEAQWCDAVCVIAEKLIKEEHAIVNLVVCFGRKGREMHAEFFDAEARRITDEWSKTETKTFSSFMMCMVPQYAFARVKETTNPTSSRWPPDL